MGWSVGSAVQQWKGGLLKMIAVGETHPATADPDRTRRFRALKRVAVRAVRPGRHAARAVAKINKEVRDCFDRNSNRVFSTVICSSRSQVRPRT